jgi:hypothetical protein
MLFDTSIWQAMEQLFSLSLLSKQACLVAPIFPKFYYAKRRFPVISKYRQMHEILNVDEIKN